MKKIIIILSIISLILLSACINQKSSKGLGHIRGYLFEVNNEYYLVQDIGDIKTQSEISNYIQSAEIYPTIVAPTLPPDFFDNVRNNADEKLQQRITELIEEYNSFDTIKCKSDYEKTKDAMLPLEKTWEQVCEEEKQAIKDIYTLLKTTTFEIRPIYDSKQEVIDVLVMAVKDDKYYWDAYVNPSNFEVSDWRLVYKEGLDVFTVEKAELILDNYLKSRGITGTIKAREYVSFRSSQFQQRIEEHKDLPEAQTPN